MIAIEQCELDMPVHQGAVGENREDLIFVIYREQGEPVEVRGVNETSMILIGLKEAFVVTVGLTADRVYGGYYYDPAHSEQFTSPMDRAMMCEALSKLARKFDACELGPTPM